MKALGYSLLILVLGAVAWMFFFQTEVELPQAFGQPAKPSALAESAPEPSLPPSLPTRPCPDCEGTGTLPCLARNCDHGKLPCPGPCLKVSVGKWEKKDVPGHSPDELWQEFRNSKGGHMWTQSHIGEVIVESNGTFVNTGPCSVCKGVSTIACTICQGSGKSICKTCQGNKVILVTIEAAKPSDPTQPLVIPAEPTQPPAVVQPSNP